MNWLREGENRRTLLLKFLNYCPKGEVRGGVLGVVAVSLTFLRAVDTLQADTVSALVGQDFEGLAIEDVGGEVGGARSSGPLLSWSFFCRVGALTFPLGQLGGW
jgi:hypothetical protein